MAVKDLRANSERISDYDEQIRSLNNRKKKLMEQNKQTVYDILAELYGKQNQELVDVITDEHKFVEYLTEGGLPMTDIAKIIDNYKEENGKADSAISPDADLDGQMKIEY